MAETVLIAAALLALAVVSSGLLRRLHLPESVVLVLVGMALAALAQAWPPAAPALAVRLEPELVFLVLLPALVFESGLNLDARRLLGDLAPVLVMAVPALLLSTALIAAGLHWLAGLAPAVALLFGALISATDPVAVVALFREIGAPARLGVLVEGESLFNDASAIVVFGLVLGMLVSGNDPRDGALVLAPLRFLIVFLGGALAGAMLGALASELTHRLGSPAVAVVAMSVAVAYASFALAEHLLGVSGVMAAVTAAITLGALGAIRLDASTRQAQRDAWELLAFACNALLFLLVGLAVNLQSLLGQWPLILLTVALVQAARAIAVHTLVPFTTWLFRRPPVSRAERHVMWWGGLKGGLAVAMVLSIPPSLPARQQLLDLTVGVVLTLLLVNASSLRLLMRRLGLARMSRTDRAELVEAVTEARARVTERLSAFREAGVLPAATHHELLHSLMTELVPEAGSSSASTFLALRLGALKAEATALVDLHDCGAIETYSFLELRDLLVKDRARATEGAGSMPRESANRALRLEGAVLGLLRRYALTGRLLGRYQRMRVATHLQHAIAGAVMARAALDALPGSAADEPDEIAALREEYRERNERRCARLSELAVEFPDICERERDLHLRRAALCDARRHAEEDRRAGRIGARALSEISAIISDALRRRTVDAPPLTEVRTLLAGVPLFRGLSPQALAALAGEIRPLPFLAGDVVIGEGERGDALYAVSHGQVRITRKGEDRPLAELGDGDFFGEAALLGDAQRNATVTATRPSMVLRITRERVLSVARRWPEVEETLRAANARRRGAAR